MTTQEPVPGLDELWEAYEDAVRGMERCGCAYDCEPRRDAARTALITAIEAPWREALRGLVESMPQVLFWKSKLTDDSMSALHAYYVHVEEARALLNRDQEAEVNDD